MSKIVLGLVGDLAAGKGTIAKYCTEKHHASTHRFSTMLRDMLNRIYVAQTRENIQALSTFIRRQYGEDIMSKVIAEDVKNDNRSLIVMDGIRRPTDITYLQDLPGFNLVYVTAEQKIRWERMVLRGENTDDAHKTFTQFVQDEQAEADSLIKELGQKAKFTIHNNGTLDKLFAQIENILTQTGYAN